MNYGINFGDKKLINEIEENVPLGFTFQNRCLKIKSVNIYHSGYLEYFIQKDDSSKIALSFDVYYAKSFKKAARGNVFYRTEIKSLTSLNRAINDYYKNENFKAKIAFIVTWQDIEDLATTPNKNTFQAVLTTDHKFYYLIYIYHKTTSDCENCGFQYDLVSYLDIKDLNDQRSNVEVEGLFIYEFCNYN